MINGNTLFVIDMQKDFVDGSLGSKEAEAIVDNVVKKINEYKDINANIYVTLDTHYDNYLETHEGKNLPVKHCIKGTDGWKLNDKVRKALDSYPNVTYIEKDTFGYDGWKDEFNENNPVDIPVEFVGLCTDICVISNILVFKASYKNTDIFVDANCCAGVTPEAHEAALKVLESCQVKVIK